MQQYETCLAIMLLCTTEVRFCVVFESDLTEKVWGHNMLDVMTSKCNTFLFHDFILNAINLKIKSCHAEYCVNIVLECRSRSLF